MIELTKTKVYNWIDKIAINLRFFFGKSLSVFLDFALKRNEEKKNLGFLKGFDKTLNIDLHSTRPWSLRQAGMETWNLDKST